MNCVFATYMYLKESSHLINYLNANVPFAWNRQNMVKFSMFKISLSMLSFHAKGQEKSLTS